MKPPSDKVLAIFQEIVGDRASALDGSHFPADINTRITKALLDGRDSETTDCAQKDQLAFHLVDWQRDAAFIVALVLFPDRFTDEEIRDEIDRFLWHVPAHVIEAARLGGYPNENIFCDADKKTAERAGAANPCACGTSGTSAAEQPLVPEASRDT